MKHLLLLFTLLVFTLSCSDDITVIEESEMGIIQVSCFYTTKDNPNLQVPDVNSKVFVYFGYYSVDFSNFLYQREGRLIKGDSVILPDQNAIIGENGQVVLELVQTDKPFTFIIESNHYKKTMIYSYPEKQKEIVFTAIFNP